jgi:hypothetical protein
MMTQLCSTLQQRILDAPADKTPELAGPEAAHLRECPECRELWVARLAVAPEMEALGAEARQVGELEARAAAALKQRVLNRLRQMPRNTMSSAGQSAPDAAGVRPRTARVVPPVVAAPWWLSLLQALRPAHPARWVAATVCLCLLAAGGWGWWRQRPIGMVTYAQGALRFSEGSANLTGIVQQALTRESRLSTSPAGGAVVNLGRSDEVRLAMAPATRLELTGPHSLRLEQGSVWLNVQPHGRGFQVQTPQGMVTVTGTIFGVTTQPNALQVDVTRGQVHVRQGGAERVVDAGQQVQGSATALNESAARAAGDTLPAWVEQLGTAETLARAASYVPSLAVKQTNRQP